MVVLSVVSVSLYVGVTTTIAIAVVRSSIYHLMAANALAHRNTMTLNTKVQEYDEKHYEQHPARSISSVGFANVNHF